MKRQLDNAKDDWWEKLLEALWVIRTSFRTSTRKTHFYIAFDSKAVVPNEIGETSNRMATFAPVGNKT